MAEGAQASELRPRESAAAAVLERVPWVWVGVGTVTAAAGAFLLHQLMAWPPHEDEALALLVGRDSLGGVVDHVTRERGGAPLHFLVAWVVAHLGLGLGALRAASAAFALASLPLVALLGLRLAGKREAVIAAAIAAGSWAFLFHGVYARMYSLFLFLSLAATLALLRALDSGRKRDWALWIVALLLTVAAHPYGVLVLGANGVYVLLARRDRLRQAAVAFGCVFVGGIPFWLTDLVLAGRFDVGVGGRGEKLGGPWAIVRYLWSTAGDFTAGWWPVLICVLVLAAVGAATTGREARLLALSLVGVPVAAFLLARLGGATSPESRHLIFVLPVFSVLVAAGIVRVTRRRPVLAAVATVLLVAAEVAWTWDRTPPLFEWEPDQRQAARADAEAWLAATSRPDDLLFGYEPIYLGAWERDRDFPRTVLPRADANLTLRTLLRQDRPLGRGVWVLDASERNNLKPRLEIDQRLPLSGANEFETHAFGPFLVVRTTEPTRTPSNYLLEAGRAQVLGRSLGIGDSAVNMLTVERADRALRGYGPSLRSRSSNSR